MPPSLDAFQAGFSSAPSDSTPSDEKEGKSGDSAEASFRASERASEGGGGTAGAAESSIHHSKADCIACCHQLLLRRRQQRVPTEGAISPAAASAAISFPTTSSAAASPPPPPPPTANAALWTEVLRLVTALSSSVGVKGNQAGLTALKQKFPLLFKDECLYR